MSVVKVVGLVKEGIHGRKGSKYPVSDQVIDVSVAAGVYAIIALLEVLLMFARGKRAMTSTEEGDRVIFGAGRFWGKYPLATRDDEYAYQGAESR